MAPGSKRFSLPRVREVLQYVVENDPESSELEDVGQHGDRRQVFEVPDAGEEQHGDQDYCHVNVVIDLPVPVVEYLVRR